MLLTGRCQPASCCFVSDPISLMGVSAMFFSLSVLWLTERKLGGLLSCIMFGSQDAFVLGLNMIL